MQSKSLGTALEMVFKSIPDNRIFLETDTVEDGIEKVYDLAAEIKGIPILEMQEIISSNFRLVFGKST